MRGSLFLGNAPFIRSEMSEIRLSKTVLASGVRPIKCFRKQLGATHENATMVVDLVHPQTARPGCYSQRLFTAACACIFPFRKGEGG